jgi:hypothetical protein
MKVDQVSLEQYLLQFVDFEVTAFSCVKVWHWWEDGTSNGYTMSLDRLEKRLDNNGMTASL